MKHLGDITKISGYTAPIVDCVIGGSPCQDLSVAGKRAGLDGERSGLFMEQIRIVKEMRKQDEAHGRADINIRPRYMVWENVPGAFSSNKGEDFRVVLEEIAKVKDENASIPMPNEGKWTTSGAIVGDGWSIAWRVLDAQFWGVPQRRRRIALVADFGGESASEILFVSKSLSGNFDKSQQERKDSTTDATGGIGADDCYTYNIGDRYGVPAEHKDLSPTLTARCGTGGNNVPAIVKPSFTMQDREGKQGGGKGALIAEEISSTLRANNAQYLFQPVTFSKSKRAQSDKDFETWKESDKANTLNGFDTGDVRTSEAVVYALDRASFNQGKNAQYDFEISDKGINSPLVAKGPGAVCYWDGGQVAGTLTANNASGQQRMPDKENFNCVIQGINGDIAGTLDSSYYKGCGMRSGVEREVVAVDCRNGSESEVNCALQSNSAHSLNGNNTVRTRYIVRRLTPLECERLQGYPDGWTDIGEYIDSNGKKRQTSDASRYKALGNSIALPPWKWVLKRICACYERDATMASLFDGIGGFPYLWEQLNGKGTCLWASEIEEFPMAVTKVRIG